MSEAIQVGRPSERWAAAARFGPFAPFAAALAAPLWFYRDFFLHGRLPGDIGDGRWTVGIFEHWFRFFHGRDGLTDTGMYVPMKNTLGMSESFLPQGVIHSILRLAGCSILTAWVCTLVVMHTVGTLGVAAISRRVLTRPWTQTCVVLLAALSYPMVAQRAHVQVASFLMVSWPLFGLVLLWEPQRWRRQHQVGFALMAVGAPLAAFSCWYGFSLGLILLLLLLAVLAFLDTSRTLRRYRRILSSAWAQARRPTGIIAVAAGLALWLLFARIHLPARHLVPPLPFSEITRYSPRVSDLVNASLVGGGVWHPVYARTLKDSTNWERLLGLTPILAVGLIAVFLSSVRAGLSGADRTTQRRRLRPLAVALAIFTLWALIITDEQGFSLWWIIWKLVPGYESVRLLARTQVFVTPLALFVVASRIESHLDTIRQRGRDAGVARRVLSTVFVVAVLGGILVEAYRPPSTSWVRDDVLPRPIATQVAAVQRDSCRYVMVDEMTGFDDRPWWAREIDGVMLGMLTGKPTLNGYTSLVPIGYPVGDVGAVVQWARAKGLQGPICIVGKDGIRTG